MDILLNILVFLLTVSILVLAHEYGHFWMARRLGVTVEKFSLGFGKPLWSWQSKAGIEYAVAPILLGGYVKLQDNSFNSKTVWRRLLIMVAGVLTNLLLATVIFWGIFSVGITLPKPVIGKIIPQSVADQAGLRQGDLITHVDGKITHTWERVAMEVLARVGDKGYLLLNNRRILLADWNIDELNPDPLQSLGIIPYTPKIPAEVGGVLSNSPAARIGLQTGDEVLAINGTKIADWFELINYVQDRPEQALTFLVKRQDKQMTLAGLVGKKRIFLSGREIGYLGITSVPNKWQQEMLQQLKFPVHIALGMALQQTWYLLSFNYIIVGKLLTGKMSLRILGGPATIFVTAEQAFASGFVSYLLFLALLSIMLAFVNMLPIPALDGGNFILLLIEGIIRRQLPGKVQMMALKIGFFILAIIIFVAVGNDLFRILQ